MIHIQLPATRKPKTYALTHSSAGRKYLTQHEINRRDGIIKDQVRDCKVKVGDWARSLSDAGFQKYGVVKVTRISDSWKTYRMDFGYGIAEADVEWKEDMPMIVTVVPYRTPGNSIVCTYNYLRPLNEEELKDHEETIRNSLLQQ